MRPSNRTWRPGRDRRAERHPGPSGAARATNRHVVIVGGGIAGLSACTHLAERGVQVTLLEREYELGGRVRSWPVNIDGETTSMSRGFHAFFRQYYQLRSLLRRADPTLSCLEPVADYPLQLKGGPRDSFARVPRTPPLNLLGFVASSPSFPVSALMKVDLDQAMGLLDVRFPQSFSDLDGVSAAELLNRLRFPDSARHLALEVFARSFFADPRDFSGGELLAMFHTYFVGSAEGLLFDVARDDFTTALWNPLAAYLQRLGVRVRCGVTVQSIDRMADSVRINTADADPVAADAVVLATDTRALQRLVADSATLQHHDWMPTITALRSSPAFAVWRRWYARPCRPGSPSFLGTSGYGPLDNVSMIHEQEQSARSWARRHNGSVVELHAYALPTDTNGYLTQSEEDLRRELSAEQDLIHPELADAPVVGEQWLVRNDCPLIDTSPWRERPSVRTPWPNVVLAGDSIRCDLPVALMERAATTGALAANALLATWGVAGTAVWSTPTTPRWAFLPPAHRLLTKLGS